MTKYSELVNSIEDEDGMYGEAGMAASSCVMAIKRIVKSVATDKENLKELQDMVFPIIVKTITPDFIDQCDETMEMANIIMYGTRTVTQKYWSIFPHLIKIVIGGKEDPEGGYAFEFFSHMMGYFANCI